MSKITFKTVVEMKPISTMDRLKGKKYMGVWRWESELTVRMMSRFPHSAKRYMDKKRPKRTICRSGSSESWMKWNSGTDVEFHMFLFLEQLLEETTNAVNNVPECIWPFFRMQVK